MKPQMRHQDLAFLPAGICLSASATALKKLLPVGAVLHPCAACRGVCTEKVQNLVFVYKTKSYDSKSKTGAE